MFSFLRIPVFLLAFVFMFFGSQGVSFAAENPVRLMERVDAESPVSAYDFTKGASNPIKFATVLFTPEARADEPAIVPAPAAIEQSDLQKIIEALGGLQGAGALGIALVVVQILMVVAKAIWSPSGGWQLTLVLSLSVVAGVLSAMVVGKMEFGAALMSSGVLAAVQVLANQVFKKTTA